MKKTKTATKKLDYAYSLAIRSIAELPLQIQESWQGVKNVKLPAAWGSSKNILVCGMGGSNLASELARAVYGEQINVPFILVRNYNLPAFAGPDSLVIVSSYSGTTEETVSCLKQARAKKCRIVCLASGGQVIALAKKYRLPYYQISKTHNPSNQPRYGVGSQLGALLGVLADLKIIRLGDEQIAAVISQLEKLNGKFEPKREIKNNYAKQLAQQLINSFPIIVAANHLSANGHILANQINESAKCLAVGFHLPELNHHLLESLTYPKNVIKETTFIFLNSSLYSPAIAKRFKVTQKVLAKQKVDFVNVEIAAKDKIFSALEALALGSWLSFYLTELYGQNPLEIPWVNYFKQELKK